MMSHEALQKAIDGKTIAHAQRQHKSSSLPHKWQEPHTDFTDSGTINPLDRVEMVIETSISLGTHPDQATAPIRYLAERFGFVCIPVPKSSLTTNQLIRSLCSSIKEFGELSTAASAAMDDGRITKAEAVQIMEEGSQVLRQVAQFIDEVKAAAGGKR